MEIEKIMVAETESAEAPLLLDKPTLMSTIRPPSRQIKSGSIPYDLPQFVIASWFWTGLFPIAPGTIGSIAAIPFAYIMIFLMGKPVFIAAIALLTLIGVWAADWVERKSGVHDASLIVVDEVIGMWIAFALLPIDHNSWWLWAIIALISFRVFDILKPFPAGWIDKNVGGAWGVILDDIFAGFYALGVTYLLYGFLIS